MLAYARTIFSAGIVSFLMLAGPAHSQSAEELSVRMTQMEDQLRQLIGQVENLTFQVRQLQDQTKGRKTGSLEAPAQQPAEAQPQPLAAADQGIEQIEDGGGNGEQIVTTVVGDDGTEQQVTIRKAPGPQILGTLSNSAAQPDDGGFQGQVIVPPAGADVGDYGADGGNPDTIETVSLSPETPEALYESSNENLLRRQFGEAEAGFRTFLQRYPDHSLAGSAQFWLGETYYAQGDFRQAAQVFLQGYQQYPKSRRAADSLLKLGISLGRLGQKQQSCAAYNAVSSEYPKAVEAKKRAQAEARRAGC